MAAVVVGLSQSLPVVRNGNDVCRAVMGAKGVGKTQLFHALVTTFAYQHANVIAVYADCTRSTYSPAALICTALRAHGFTRFADTDDLGVALGLIEGFKVKVVLLYDNFEYVYSRPKAVDALGQLYSIASQSSGRDVIFAVAGSSTSLPHLLCGAPTSLDTPTSAISNLNRSKVMHQRLDPFTM
jgi:hypothetical protein